MYSSIIEQLSKNTDIFEALVSGLSEEQQIWRPEPDKWCLLEIICSFPNVRDLAMNDAGDKPIPKWAKSHLLFATCSFHTKKAIKRYLSRKFDTYTLLNIII